MTKINKKGWEKIKLGEAFTLQMGRTPARDNSLYWGGNNKWIAISDLHDSKMTGKTKECITDAALAEANMPIIPAGTTIMSFKLTIGKTAITSEDICTNEAIMAFLPKESTAVLPDYLYYVLPVQKWEGNRAVMGKTINKKIISEHTIPLPPLPIQQRIVEELDEINAIISAKKQQLSKLDELAQSIFYNMFGDPVANEKGWEVKKYGEVFEIGSGGTPSKSKQEYWENGTIPWIGSNMCQNCFIHKTDGKFITEEGLNHSSAKLLEPNTVLVALVGATIGKTALLKTTTSTNQNVAFIKTANNESFTPEFVFFNLTSLYEEFMNIGNGDFKMANLSFVRNLPIPLPPLPLQEAFAARVSAIEEEKAAIAASIEKMQTLLDARMQEYFG